MTAAVALLAGACTTSSAEPDVTVTVQATGGSTVTVGGPASASSAGGAGGAGTPTTAPASVAPAATTPGATSAPTAAPVRFTANPAFGSKNLAPNNPVTVTVFSAKLTQVVMEGDDGTTVTGKIAADGTSWSSTQRLNYGVNYDIEGTAKPNSGGTDVPLKGAVSTIKPAKTMGMQFNIPDNAVVGVAAPIIITFLGQVQDKAAVEKALTVTSSAGAAVQGNWGWVQDEDFQKAGFKQSQVHWRPTVSSTPGTPYWPAGTKVSVTAALKGVNFGGGVWGRSDETHQFSIRPDGLVVKADASTHRLIVLQNGRVTKNYPVSYGKASDDRETVEGIHIVQSKDPTFSMCNLHYGYCNSVEKWAVRINNNGEFIHENQNVEKAGQLGVNNVSHGCINMGSADAADFYKLALFGDPVEVTNTGGAKMSAADYVYDWIYSPDQWKTLSKIS